MTPMPFDAYGLPVTTSSSTAHDTYVRAARAMLGWQASALPLFRAAAERDPGLALAHAGAAACLFLEERFGEARAASDAARAATGGLTPREQGHVAAMAAWVSGDMEAAERAMRAQLAEHPRDALIFQRLYFLLFWQGRFPEMLEFTTATITHYPGDSFVLGMHAFALEEAGRCEEAIRGAEDAIALNPSDAWAVHALAHALYESGRFDPGVTRLPPAIHPCRGLNWFLNHLLWHLALMHFARGEYERAARLSRTVFERAPSSVAGDLHDSISLLWRLELAGRPVGDRWRPFTAIAAERVSRQGLLFHVAHVAMALAAGGDWPTAERHLAMVRERAPKDRTGLTADVLVPLIEGLHAFAAADYGRTVACIEPLRPRIVTLGGSRAQRDVFHDTLFEAALRSGDAERARRWVAERVARRPDHYWTARAGA